jgi:hypothetical protein
LGLSIADVAITATDTQAGATFRWSASGLPPGLSIAGNGTVSGTPSAAGTYPVTVTAEDNQGYSGSANFAWTITPGAQLSRTTLSLAPGKAGAGYSQALAAAGGTSPYSWSVTTGSLSRGLYLNAAAGTISGKLAAGAKTTTFGVTVADPAGQRAARSYTVTVVKALALPGMLAAMPNGKGYWMASANGAAYSFGAAVLYGSAPDRGPHDPVVGMAATPDGRGYWLVSSAGQVFFFGDGRLYPARAGMALALPIVGIVATPDGRGYRLVASNGQVLNFGDAHSYGPAAKLALARPIAGMAATPGGRGYWLVASGEGIFAFGDAGQYGSVAGRSLVAPLAGMAATPSGKGYWLVASDGGHLQLR